VIKRYLWWWVGILVVFVVAAKITGNGSEAWSIAQYASLSAVSLIVLLVLIAGILEMREKRNNTKRGE
jgi:hypothetical protein